MKLLIGSLFFVILCSSFNHVNSKLPSYIQTCKRYDPQFSDCVIKSISHLQPYLVAGMKELDIPSADPFFIKNLAYGNDRSVKVQLTNVYIKGITNFRVEKLRTNLENIKIDVIISLPRLEIRSKYRLVLSLLGAPIASEGDLYASFENAKARIGLKAQKYLKNGHEYIKFEPILLKINIGNIQTLKLSNLFNGNPVLSEVVHAVLVSNSDFLLNDFYPHIEKSLSEAFTEIANKITKEATFDELFPLN